MRPSRRRTLVEPNLRLPLWRGVVFVDWHGVLSHEPFWVSLLSNPQHRHYSTIKKFVDELFGDTHFIDGWMRGKHKSTEILTRAYAPRVPRAKSDYLVRHLMRDCYQMKLDQAVDGLIQKIRLDHLVVLATDNMDCFASNALRRKLGGGVFDDVLCSSEIGHLKRDAQAFFGEWLAAHDLSFANAVLLDDNQANCDAFEQLGGKSIFFCIGGNIEAELQKAADKLLAVD